MGANPSGVCKAELSLLYNHGMDLRVREQTSDHLSKYSFRMLSGNFSIA